MSPQDSGGIEIGATLRDARRRLGLEVREVEDRTKIRARYIRALENEDWQTLPAPAYVRGFLRTYGQMLGLDGEMLADEFRRRYGDEISPAGPGPSEPVLSEPRSPSERSRSRLLLVLGVVAGIVVLLLALSLLGGDEEPEGGGGQGTGQKAAERGGNQKQQQEKKADQEPKNEQENAKLVAGTDVQVCLVGGGDQALVDNQVLSKGSKETFSGFKRYRLTLGPGRARFTVGDEKRKIDVAEPQSYEADSQGIREINYRGPDCP